MKKVVISSLVILVLVLGVGMYFGQVKDINASSVLYMEEMGRIEGGNQWFGRTCDGGSPCGTQERCTGLSEEVKTCTYPNGGEYSKCGGWRLWGPGCENNKSNNCGSIIEINQSTGEETTRLHLVAGC
jgi:hypothetical protein